MAVLQLWVWPLPLLPPLDWRQPGCLSDPRVSSPSWKGEAGRGCWTGSPGSAPAGEAGSKAPTQASSPVGTPFCSSVSFRMCREPGQRGGPRGRRRDGPWQEVAPPPLCPNPAGGRLAGSPSEVSQPGLFHVWGPGGHLLVPPHQRSGSRPEGLSRDWLPPPPHISIIGKTVAQLGPVSGKSESLNQVRLVECVEPGWTPSPPGQLPPTPPRVQG